VAEEDPRVIDERCRVGVATILDGVTRSPWNQGGGGPDDSLERLRGGKVELEAILGREI
jgi:hypothetical protein